jgi:hypothetical protein
VADVIAGLAFVIGHKADIERTVHENNPALKPHQRAHELSKAQLRMGIDSAMGIDCVKSFYITQPEILTADEVHLQHYFYRPGTASTGGPF